MSDASEKNSGGRQGGLSDALAAQLDSDARFGSGVARDLTEAERLRIQTAGSARPSLAPTPVPVEEEREDWAEAVARLLQSEKAGAEAAPVQPAKPVVRRPETPRAPALEEAEQFLRELEAQPRERPEDEESGPGSEVAF